MKNPTEPDTQPNQYLPEAPNAHKDRPLPPDRQGINPRATDTMPRGEDDAETRADSPEFNDRTDLPDAGTNNL